MSTLLKFCHSISRYSSWHDKVLGFFGEVEKKELVELLSMNVLIDGIVESFVAYKENEQQFSKEYFDFKMSMYV